MSSIYTVTVIFALWIQIHFSSIASKYIILINNFMLDGIILFSSRIHKVFETCLCLSNYWYICDVNMYISEKERDGSVICRQIILGVGSCRSVAWHRIAECSYSSNMYYVLKRELKLWKPILSSSCIFRLLACSVTGELSTVQVQTMGKYIVSCQHTHGQGTTMSDAS